MWVKFGKFYLKKFRDRFLFLKVLLVLERYYK